MNDFHFLTIALANKNKQQAMLLLRDKNEFAARKIMQKAGVNVPPLTGRLFWRWVQEYIFSACRPQPETRYETIAKPHRDNKPASDHNARLSEPGSYRSDKSNGASGHDSGSLQHPISESSQSGTVCTGKNGVSSVHHNMGHKHNQNTGKASDEGKSAVDMGGGHAACVYSGISRAFSVARAQHSVCIRRRDATAGMADEIRPERRRNRHLFTRGVNVSTLAGKLWYSGRSARSDTGSVFRQQCNAMAAGTGGRRSVRRALQPERFDMPSSAAFRNDDSGHITHIAFPLARATAGWCADAGRLGTLHAPPVFLLSLYLASAYTRHCLFLVKYQATSACTVIQILEVLATVNAMTTVAMDSGYDNVSVFFSLFSQVWGYSPAV